MEFICKKIFTIRNFVSILFHKKLRTHDWHILFASLIFPLFHTSRRSSRYTDARGRTDNLARTRIAIACLSFNLGEVFHSCRASICAAYKRMHTPIICRTPPRAVKRDRLVHIRLPHIGIYYRVKIPGLANKARSDKRRRVITRYFEPRGGLESRNRAAGLGGSRDREREGTNARGLRTFPERGPNRTDLAPRAWLSAIKTTARGDGWRRVSRAANEIPFSSLCATVAQLQGCINRAGAEYSGAAASSASLHRAIEKERKESEKERKKDR